MITLIRHGESEFNINDKDTEPDCSLTDLGREQSKLLKFHFDLLIVSPMKRTRETWEYSEITADEVLILDLVREHKIKPCDFLHGEEQTEETEEQLLDRVSLLKEILPKDKKIGIIGHGDFFWYFTSHFVEGERFGKWLENGENYKMETEVS